MNNKHKLISTWWGGTNRVIVMALFFLIIGMLSIGTGFAADQTVSGTNFQSIQDEIDSADSGDRILLGSKNYTSSGSRILVSDNKDLTIQGSSNTNRATLNANNLHGILYIQSGSSATIRYVNFVEGGSSNSGSSNHALGAHGTVLIENCNFIDSRGDSGSAIYINTTAPNSIIRNCNFTNNYANNHGDNDYTAGGAVCIHGADNTEVRNCYFSGNTALDYGGALTIRNTALNAKVINCDFVNNKAPNGGAIYNQLGTTTISGCTFTNNQATNLGGAIYSTSSLNIVSSSFTNNGAKNGGAIYSTHALVISSCSFNQNTAKNNGGAIFLSGSSMSTISESSKFKSNSAKNGGAIYSVGSLNIMGGTVSGNTATYGSGIYNLGTLEITGTIFKSNTADIRKIDVISEKSVVAGDKINIEAYVIAGDNVIGAIYTKNSNININGQIPLISDKVVNKDVTLTVDSQTYYLSTDSNGKVILEVSTSPIKGVSVNILGTVSSSKKEFKKKAKVKVKIDSKRPKKVTKTKTTIYAKGKTTVKFKKGKVEKIVYTKGKTVKFMRGKKEKVKKIVYTNDKIVKHMKNGKKYTYYNNIKNTTEYSQAKQRYKDSEWSGYDFDENNMIYKGRYLNYNIITTTITETVDKNGKTISSVKDNITTVVTYKKISKGKFKRITTITETIFIGDKIVNSPYIGSGNPNEFYKVDTNDMMLKNLASSITMGFTNDYDKTNAIYNWVRKNIQYVSGAQLSASDVYNQKIGNCVGLSNLITALCRISDIPAQYETKVAFDTRVAFESQDKLNYTQLSKGHVGHMWALIYMEDAKGWINSNQYYSMNGWCHADGTFRNYQDYDIIWGSLISHWTGTVESNYFIYYLHEICINSTFEHFNYDCNWEFGSNHQDTNVRWT